METSDASWRDSIGDSVKTVKAEDDFLQFKSRFTIIEDAGESIFHLPEEMEPGAKCSNCGRPAKFVQRATGLRATTIEGGASYDRVKSEYKTFNLQLCGKCRPSSRFTLSRWDYPIILLFIAAILWLVGWAFIADTTYIRNSAMAGYLVSLEGGISVVLIILLLFPAYLIYKNQQSNSRVRRYIHANEVFLWQMRDDGWFPIFNQNLIHSPKIITITDYLESLVKHHPTLCYLFPDELGQFRRYGMLGEKIVEFTPGVVKDPVESTEEGKCTDCSETASEKFETTIFREICTFSPDGWEGIARDYACAKVSIDSESTMLGLGLLIFEGKMDDWGYEYSTNEIKYPQNIPNRDWMILQCLPYKTIELSERFLHWLNENSSILQETTGFRVARSTGRRLSSWRE